MPSRASDLPPKDGVVLEGTSHVDESTFMGELAPVRKDKGTELSSGTTNGSSTLVLREERVSGVGLLLSPVISSLAMSFHPSR